MTIIYRSSDDHVRVFNNDKYIGRIETWWEERTPGSWWVDYTFTSAAGARSRRFPTLAVCRQHIDGSGQRMRDLTNIFGGDDDDAETG